MYTFLKNKDVLFYLIIFVIPILISIFNFLLNSVKIKKTKQKIKELADNTLEITPKEFFEIKNSKTGRKSIVKQYDFAGVYILYNSTKNMYYVGQSVNVFKRVNNHLTGHGNGDVYADLKYGDDFKIKMIALANSGFNTLNTLERNTIMTYNAYAKGYNKTKGNKG